MPPQPIIFNRERLIKYFFFIAFAFLLYQLLLLFKPFMTAILGSTVVALAFYPLYVRLKRLVRSAKLASFIMTFLAMLIIVCPLVWGIWFVLKETDWLIPVVQDILTGARTGDFSALNETLPPSLNDLLNRVIDFVKKQEIDIEPTLLIENLKLFVRKFSSWGALFAKHTVVSLLNIVIMLFTLFFAFKDGDALLKWILSLIPLEQSHKEAIARRAYETFRAVTIGVTLTATAQGFTAFIAFWIAGVKIPFLLGLATFMFSLLGASFLVTLPVALFVLKTNTFWGIFLLFWGLIVVGWLDNLLKPFLIGSKARMPFILIFFSIIGGIKMYGLLGLILGPVLVASVLTFVKIYREQFNPEQQTFK
ncbi:MAG: AI-2E family transporter [Elusimicrobia bacterium]|nr:AI-2E family transporter [Candidatus Obscuribacterium magneticum]